MYRLMKLLAVLAITSPMVACVTTQTKVPQETLANIRTIGIAAALGDEFSFVSYGMTIMSNDRRKTFVPEWHWDRLALQKMQTGLSGKFSVSTVETDKESLLRVAKTPYETLAQQAFTAITKPMQPPDAYLVILRGNERDLSGSRTVDGIGAFREDRVIRYVPQYAVYAIFDLLLIDAKSGRLLAASEGRIGCPECIAADSVAIRRIEGSSQWPADFPSLFAQYRDQLRDAEAGLIGDSISWTLKQMGLTK